MGAAVALAVLRATSPAARSCRRTTRTSRKQWLMADTKHVHRHVAGRRRRRQLQRHRLVRRHPDGDDAVLPGARLGHVRVHGIARDRAERHGAAGRRCARAATGAGRATGSRTLQTDAARRRTCVQLPHGRSARLSTYGWIDQGAGTVRMPIDRAKDLALERGLPARPGRPRRAAPGRTSCQRAPSRPAARHRRRGAVRALRKRRWTAHDSLAWQRPGARRVAAVACRAVCRRSRPRPLSVPPPGHAGARADSDAARTSASTRS